MIEIGPNLEAFLIVWAIGGTILGGIFGFIIAVQLPELIDAWRGRSLGRRSSSDFTTPTIICGVPGHLLGGHWLPDEHAEPWDADTTECVHRFLRAQMQQAPRESHR